jgi:D-alanyl-lipoteichoic acid acyltransferase DltB (MBOAT superfamily)
MLFNSPEFVVFFVITTSLFFLLPHSFRWLLLLLASCIFYMFFKPEYILILAFTIAIDYYAGIKIESAPDHAARKRYLVLSLCANIGILAVFKYYNFINDNITGLFAMTGHKNPIPYLKILLPLGLSFHTFQAMSYTIEIYRGNQKAERHFGIYSLYVMFYPQLVAGPIERPQNILHQFHEKKYFDYERVLAGLRLMLLGFFKKIVIADRLGIYVDSIYRDVEHANSISVAIALFFFAFQVYCDFSGYSDIALGSAKVMGYDLMKNFDKPFMSKNITEFWRRWHISLSTWFNDYLFTPLVIKKRDWGKWGVVFGLMITFLLSGLWHGAGWPFLIYGALYGIAVSFEFLTKKTRTKISRQMPAFVYNNISRLLTFIYLCLALVFFRAGYIGKAMLVYKTLFSFKFSFNLTQLCAGKGPLNLLISFAVIVSFYLINRLYQSRLVYIFSTVALFSIVILSKDVSHTFIYFQF